MTNNFRSENLITQKLPEAEKQVQNKTKSFTNTFNFTLFTKKEDPDHYSKKVF